MADTPSAAAFLAAHDPQAREDVRWGELRLHVATYLCTRLPPAELITSARAVMLQAGQVMVVRDPGSVHILPGGRRQAGESLEQTLRRELLEETGWAIDEPHLLGIKHFRHRNLKPAGFPYPDYLYPDYLYPDFFQAVYVAHARSFHPAARELGGYELGAAFHPVADVQHLALPPSERLFLDAALSWRGSAECEAEPGAGPTIARRDHPPSEVT
jgi:8-oxo-dGTP pyrophosphatase MutT (NUDIX family)